jgi:hypothetical protein
MHVNPWMGFVMRTVKGKTDTRLPAAGRRISWAGLPRAIKAPAKHVQFYSGDNAAAQAYWGMMYRSSQSFCTSDGIPTTVCFGFLRSLAALLEQEQPHALIVAFDAPAKSFRCAASYTQSAQ